MRKRLIPFSWFILLGLAAACCVGCVAAPAENSKSGVSDVCLETDDYLQMCSRRTAYVSEYLVMAESLGSYPGEHDIDDYELVKLSVFERQTKSLWTQNVQLPQCLYLGGLDSIRLFNGRNLHYDILVVKYFIPVNFGGSILFTDYMLSVFEIAHDKHLIRPVLQLEIGSDMLGVQSYKDDSDFFDVEIKDGQVFFLLFERTESDKIAQVKKYILKEEGFVPVEFAP